MNQDHLYMLRCLQLARLGAGFVAPNPMVGAVLVNNGRIIGEGYHSQYGKEHAEVNCLNSVKTDYKHLIASSSLYVSLEPCSHFGKTPPCTDLILKNNIRKVYVGCGDSFEKVNGKGIEQLQNAGVEVITPVLEKECLRLNKRFFTFHSTKRPYIILKWAQTVNSKIAQDSPERLFISNEYVNKLVHKWRSEEAAIMVGRNTAQMDNPLLTNRLWSGSNPARMVIDMDLKLKDLKIFNNEAPTIIFNRLIEDQQGNMVFKKLSGGKDNLQEILDVCYQTNILSILVEGGAKLLQSFIDAGYWDEARVIVNENLYVSQGVNAPNLNNATTIHTETIADNKLIYFKNKNQQFIY